MNSQRKFLKNNLFVFSNRIFSKIITFIIMLFIARIMSAQSFGELSLIIALANIFSIIQDFGTSVIVVRETTLQTSDDKKIIVSTFVLKVFSGIISFLGIIIFTKILGYSYSIQSVSYLYAFGLLGESFFLSIVKHFEGREEMKISSILVVVERIILAAIIFVLASSINLIKVYGIAYIASNFSVMIIGLIIIFKKYYIFDYIDAAIIKKIFFLSLPFVLYNIFSVLYVRADLFFISYFSGDKLVGVYRASYQIIESFYFISLSLSITLLPFFTRNAKQDNSNLNRNYSFILKNLIILGMFLTITFFFNANSILEILYGNKYLSGAMVFSLLSVTIPLYYSNNVIGNLLIGIGKEKIQIGSMIISTIFKLFALFILIQEFDIVGAALTAIFSEIIALVIQYRGSYMNGYRLHIDKNDIFKVLILIVYGFIIWFSNSLIITILLSIPLSLYLFYDLFLVIKRNFSKNY